MPKKVSIEIVDIDLDIDVKAEILKAAKNISDETKEAAKQIVEEQAEKQAAKDAIKKEKQDKKDEWSKRVDTCISLLKGKMEEEDPFISCDDLLGAAEVDDLTTLMLRLNNYIKKSDLGLKLDKKKRKKKAHYRLIQA